MKRKSTADGDPPQDLIIIGAGDFGMELLWMIEDINGTNSGEAPCWNIAGFLRYADRRPNGRQHLPRQIVSHPVFDDPQQILSKRPIYFVCAIGDGATREHESARAEARGWKPATLVHPGATIAASAEIGPGACCAPGCIISAAAKIGAHVMVNFHVSVGHRATMEDFSTASPGARISGGCIVRRGAFLGANATLYPGVSVGENAVVGANSFAVRAVEDFSTVVGVPAKRIYRRAAPKRAAGVSAAS